MAAPKGNQYAKGHGRPSLYSDELAEKICHEFATTDKGLREICEEEGMPEMRTIQRWITENESFRRKYAHARELQAEYLADQIIEIADDKHGDVMMIKRGDEEVEAENREFINRSRVKIDARKWKASKLYPKKYSERVDITSDGEKIQEKIDYTKLSDQVLKEIANAKKE